MVPFLHPPPSFFLSRSSSAPCHPLCIQSDVTQTCWVTVVPMWIVLEDLEAQALHRTCSWTLGTGAEGLRTLPAVLPVFCFTLIMNHDLLEPKSVCSVGKKVRNVAKMGIGLGRKSLRLEGTPGQAFLGFWGSRCPRFSRQTEFLLCLLCFRTHCILEI